jgi:hypothetical protein
VKPPGWKSRATANNDFSTLNFGIMDTFQFEQPTQNDIPKSGASYPWVRFIEYKSGKTPAAFAADANPEQVKAGFSYYDKDTQQTVHLEKFTGTIIAMLSGVQGTVPDGTRYINYHSNLVSDTRYQTIDVRMGYGENSVLVASGIYQDFKKDLPQGVGYAKYAILYDHASGDCVAMRLTAGLEQSLREAIAAETKQAAARVNLFDLFQVQGRFWAFHFGGKFTKRTKEGELWTGHGDMFFYPELKAGITTSQKYPALAELEAAVPAYLEADQAAKAKRNQGAAISATSTATAPPAQKLPQPTANTPQPQYDPFAGMEAPPVGTLEGEDLPF